MVKVYIYIVSSIKGSVQGDALSYTSLSVNRYIQIKRKVYLPSSFFSYSIALNIMKYYKYFIAMESKLFALFFVSLDK